MPLDLSADDFERLVSDELDALPDDMVDGLQNIAFVIEDRPAHGDDLFGVYEGVDLTHRDRYGFGELPDRIVLYRLAHLASADSLDDLRDEVHTTLVHEIGHYYGIDDDRLHQLGWA
jgi:predicted Zn-dependent protease with MMP-like domain